jgi:hypothetical protein
MGFDLSHQIDADERQTGRDMAWVTDNYLKYLAEFIHFQQLFRQ